MQKELFINYTTEGSEIALLEDSRLVELHLDKHETQFSTGDIYLGKVRKLLPGLNAAFIDVGYEKDAFIHYTDLSPSLLSLLRYTKLNVFEGQSNPDLAAFKLEAEIPKTGKIEDVLKQRMVLPVQIIKEPISTKGPRLSCEISIPGRYLVLTPFADSIGISKKIASVDERNRLKNIIESIKPKHFGVIVRTVAEGKGSKEILQDLQDLQVKWETLVKNLKHAEAPKKLLSEIDKTTSILRDLLNDSFQKITTDNAEYSNEVETFLERISPNKKGIVSTYSGATPLYDNYGITKQIKTLFGRTVHMKNGGYLIIEHTEAMHVIDVNSGNKANNSGEQDDNALKMNLEAAKEIARQLRLRDLGGIIIIDFIDMKNPDSKEKVYQEMENLLKLDRAEHTVLPLSKFCLMQITRERTRPEVNISTAEVCPSCKGSGKIEASLRIVDDIERNVQQLLLHHKELKLFVHPYVEAYIRKGFWSVLNQWRWKFKKNIKLYSNNNLGLTEFKFYDELDELIRL